VGRWRVSRAVAAALHVRKLIAQGCDIALQQAGGDCSQERMGHAGDAGAVSQHIGRTRVGWRLQQAGDLQAGDLQPETWTSSLTAMVTDLVDTGAPGWVSRVVYTSRRAGLDISAPALA